MLGDRRPPAGLALLDWPDRKQHPIVEPTGVLAPRQEGVIQDTAGLRERVVARLLEASDRRLEPAKVADDTTLRDDLGLSSLQGVTLAMDLEDEFDIVVDDAELRAFVTVGDVVGLVRGKTSHEKGNAAG